MTTALDQPRSAPPMVATGILPALITSLFPTHDLSHLYPAPPEPKPGLISQAMKLFDDVAMGMDLIDFVWSVGLMPISRGLVRIFTGHGRPDFGLHILYLPWTAVHCTDANEHTLRRYHVQCRHVCGSSQGYWLAVGSRQAVWAVEILTRTMSGRAPRPWSDRQMPPLPSVRH